MINKPMTAPTAALVESSLANMDPAMQHVLSLDLSAFSRLDQLYQKVIR